MVDSVKGTLRVDLMVGNVANMTAVPGISSRHSRSFPLYKETKPKAKKSPNTGTPPGPEIPPKITAYLPLKSGNK